MFYARDVSELSGVGLVGDLNGNITAINITATLLLAVASLSN